MKSVHAVILTYNHGNFIARSIKAALNQRLTYDYKIIVHDDASTDGTVDICRRLQEEYPERIEFLISSINKGMGKSSAKAISHCTADYVALCEGDDYWCDNKKLQKQVDFLETHSDYSMCCHRVYFKKIDERPKLRDDEFMSSNQATFDIKMMAKHGNLVASPSVVYRNKLFNSLPTWFEEAPVLDYVLHMTNAKHGPIKYFPDPMAVYCQHLRGAWSGQTDMVNASNMIKTLELLLTEDFEPEIKQGLRGQVLKNQAVYLRELMKQNWDDFQKEFDRMLGNDKEIATAMIQSLTLEIESIRNGRVFKTVEKLKRFSGYR